MDELKELEKNLNPEETPKEVVPDIEIPTLRTYKTDVHQTIHRDKITTAKILIAEQNKKRNIEVTQSISDTSIKRPTNILVLILTIILLTLSVGGIGYFGYTKFTQREITPIKAPESFVFVFDKQEFISTPQNTDSLIENLQEIINNSTKNKDNTYTEVLFYKINEQTDEKNLITSTEFLSLFNINTPTPIIRSLSKDFVYGIYTNQGTSEPFLIIGVSDYEMLYTNMFVWESTLALDIKDIFPNLKNLFSKTQKEISSTSTTTSIQPSISTSTNTILNTSSTTITFSTTSTSTNTEIESREAINRTIRFIDSIFSNKDARVVRDQYGNPFFYYGFIDKTKILFAQDPKLIQEISKKIKNKNLVQ